MIENIYLRIANLRGEMPSIRQLEYLVAISDARHFRRAAEGVGASQPTVSAQLKALELQLGAQLIERDRSSVITTPVGEQVVALARRVLQDVQEIRDVAARRGGEFAEVIRLGLPPTIGPYLLPKIIPDLHKGFPDLKLYVREDKPQALPPALKEGRYDVLIMPLPVRDPGLETLAIFREPLFIAIPADHPLAEKRTIVRKDLKGQSILALESGHQLQKQVEAVCEEVGAKLMFNYEGTSLDTLREMVGMGMGLSFLPGLYVRSSLGKDPSVRVSELEDRSLHRTIGLVWRKTSYRSSEFKTLAVYLRRTIQRDFADFMLI